MTNVDWKDVAVRSFKTFVETIVAFLIVEMKGISIFESDATMWVGLGVSALAAGVAAVYNGVIRPLLKLPK